MGFATWHQDEVTSLSEKSSWGKAQAEIIKVNDKMCSGSLLRIMETVSK